MNTKIIFPFAACIGMAMAFVSCQKQTQKHPAFARDRRCNSVLEEIEAVAGDHIDIEDLFRQRGSKSGAGDIHNGEGHAHDEGEEGQEEEHEHGLVCTAAPTGALRNVDIEGTKRRRNCTSMCR